MSIRPPAARDTLPDDVSLADIWLELKALSKTVTLALEQMQSVGKRQGDHDARIAKLEQRHMNGSEHPGPQGE